MTTAQAPATDAVGVGGGVQQGQFPHALSPAHRLRRLLEILTRDHDV